MNKPRRKLLEELQTKIHGAKCDLELIRDDEQEYIDNMPESLQQSERAERAEEAISNMEDAISSLEEAIDSIENASA